MRSHRHSEMVSRRTALAGLGVGGLGLAMATHRGYATAQDASDDLTEHPGVGCWLAMVTMAPDAPPVANVSIVSGDGFIVNMAPVSRTGPQGTTIASGGAGRWETTGERSFHFTTVQVLSDPDGVFLGTLTVDGYPTVSEDGMSFIDDSPESHATLRDPVGTVTSTIEPHRDTNPLMAMRIDVGSPGFPEATPEVARTTKVHSLP